MIKQGEVTAFCSKHKRLVRCNIPMRTYTCPVCKRGITDEMIYRMIGHCWGRN